MLTEYQKKVINLLEDKVSDSVGFNWDKLGMLILKGGLPKMRKQSRVAPNFIYSSIKPAESDEHLIPSLPRHKKPYLTLRTVDLYDHPRYMSLEYMRALFLELLDQENEEELIDLKQSITRLEQDLNLSPDMIAPSGIYYKRLSVPNIKFRPHFIFDPYKPAIASVLYSTDLEKAPLNIKTPYSVPALVDLGLLTEEKQQYTSLLDPSYWALLHNSFIKGPSFLTPLRRFIFKLCNKDVKKMRAIQLTQMLASFRNHYQNVTLFHKRYFHKRNTILTRFLSLSSELRTCYPVRLPFQCYPINSVIYSVKSYWRSSALALTNRKYILKPSKVVPKNYKFKIDPSLFLPVNRKKKLSLYHKTDSIVHDISQFNLISTIKFSEYRLYTLTAYSKVPTAGHPYWTRHPRTKKRLRLRDLHEGRRIQIIRDKVFQALKERWLPAPIYVEYPTKSCLSGLALYFMNYDTRHHYQYRGDPQYTSREQYMLRLLITQGVIFEYWDDNPNLLKPGQRVQLQLQNLGIDKLVGKRVCNPLELTIKIENPEVLPDLEDDSEEYNPSSELRGRFKLYFKIAKARKKLKNFIRESIYLVIDIVRRAIFELSLPLLGLFVLFESVVDTYRDFYYSPSIQKILTLFSTWDALSSLDDGQFELNDYFNKNLAEFRVLDDTGDAPGDELNPDDVDIDPDDDEFIDFKDANTITSFSDYFSDYYYYFERLREDLGDLFIMNIPYYTLLILRPIANILLLYPLWTIIDLLTLLHIYLKNELIFWYDSFLSSNRSIWLKRLVILTKWFLKSLAFILFVGGGIFFIDYNELQMLIVYTFDIQFHDMYYTIYVMFLVLLAFYLFGPNSFKAFIKDELGLSNLAFLVTCTGSVTVEGYELQPRLFKFSKDLYNFARFKGLHVEFEQRDEHAPLFYGDYAGEAINASGGHTATSGQPPLTHFTYDELEFLVEAQFWHEPDFNPDYQYEGVRFPLLKSVAKTMYEVYLQTDGSLPFDVDKDSDPFKVDDVFNNPYSDYVVDNLVSDEITKTDKTLKTPISWYNNRERSYYHTLYNGRHVAPFRRFRYVTEQQTVIKKPKRYARDYYDAVHHGNLTLFRRPGMTDPQVYRLAREADPALFSSTRDDV